MTEKQAKAIIDELRRRMTAGEPPHVEKGRFFDIKHSATELPPADDGEPDFGSDVAWALAFAFAAITLTILGLAILG